MKQKKKLKRKEWKITVAHTELLFFLNFSVDYLEDVLCHEFASLALSSMAGKLIIELHLLRRCWNISKAIFQTVYDRIIIFICFNKFMFQKLSCVQKGFKAAVGSSPGLFIWLVYFLNFFLCSWVFLQSGDIWTGRPWAHHKTSFLHWLWCAGTKWRIRS